MIGDTFKLCFFECNFDIESQRYFYGIVSDRTPCPPSNYYNNVWKKWKRNTKL